jgi:UDP-N-acetylglucosamine 2-epimerase (non-hydrolysing)
MAKNNRKIKALIIFGTRPEAIKLAPVIKELFKNSNLFKTRICVTGQHREMLDQVLEFFEIKSNHDLNIMKSGQDLFLITESILHNLKAVLKSERPDIVLVQGDTTTTMTASIAAFYYKIKIGHIEAGLRTFEKFAPFPEEVNRKVASAIADLHFAPTESARNNLLKEGISDCKIFVTGNTVIDSLFYTVKKIKSDKIEKGIIISLINRFPSIRGIFNINYKIVDGKKIILVTGHRRENFGKGFESICLALKEIAGIYPNIEIIYPVHLNPNVQEPVHRILNRCSNIHLINPLDYLPFVLLMELSYIIITDSGGVQEEAPSLGKPVLVMRETTERPEALNAGTVMLVGTNKKKIIENTIKLIDDRPTFEKMSKAQNPYGDGKAAQRIVRILKKSI